jgi:hypothetical protein
MRRALTALLLVFAPAAAVTNGSSGAREPDARPIVTTRALAFGAGVRVGSGPEGPEDRAVTISVAAIGDSPYRIVCSVTCSDGVSGTFSAHYGPGIFAGFIEPAPAGLDISGRVICLNVFGRKAIVGGVIEQSNVAAAIGRSYLISIEDRGYASSRRDIVFGAVTPGSCSLFGGYSPVGPVGSGPALEDGNFVVRSLHSHGARRD